MAESEFESIPRVSAEAAEELAYLRRRLDDMTAELSRRPQPDVHVEVNVPPPTQRLRIFTGFPPTGGNECDFFTWTQQVDSLLLNADIKAKDPRILSSLRGIALNSVKDLNTNEEIIVKLRSLFGSIDDSETQLFHFACQKIQTKEKPVDFLLRLWGELIEIGKTSNMIQEELHKKLYRTFLNGLQTSHSLLVFELRNNFGFPGTSSPAFDKLLLAVRRASEAVPLSVKTGSIASSMHQASPFPDTVPEIDYDKLAEKVAAKLQASKTDYDKLAEKVAVRLQTSKPVSRRPKGPCYNCGVVGDHFAANCRNPPNPNQVVTENAKIRLRNQGANPLNGRQSMEMGRH